MSRGADPGPVDDEPRGPLGQWWRRTAPMGPSPRAGYYQCCEHCDQSAVAANGHAPGHAVACAWPGCPGQIPVGDRS